MLGKTNQIPNAVLLLGNAEIPITNDITDIFDQIKSKDTGAAGGGAEVTMTSLFELKDYFSQEYAPNNCCISWKVMNS